MTKELTFAIIGAGPVGLHAACHILNDPELKHCQVIVIERGPAIASGMQKWDFVKLFSNFKFNVSSHGLDILNRAKEKKISGSDTIDPDKDNEEYFLASDYIKGYLFQLGEFIRNHERGRLLLNTNVAAVGKDHLLKHNAIGDKTRGEFKFRILVEEKPGNHDSGANDCIEKVLEANVLFDASGCYGNAVFFGAGGVPALGERKLPSKAITYIIPDILGQERERYVNKRTLVIGSGYSAITAINHLLKLKKEEAGVKTSIVWMTRRGTNPYERIENDPLPERDVLAELGNTLSENNGLVEYKGPMSVVSVEYKSDSSTTNVTLEPLLRHPPSAKEQDSNEKETVVVDQIISCCGFKPDLSIVRELHGHPCWATEGPIKLAASMMSSTSPDCLAQVSPGPDLLKNPEPHYFVIGGKSYGRSSKFIIKIGIEQIEQILTLYKN